MPYENIESEHTWCRVVRPRQTGARLFVWLVPDSPYCLPGWLNGVPGGAADWMVASVSVARVSNDLSQRCLAASVYEFAMQFILIMYTGCLARFALLQIRFLRRIYERFFTQRERIRSDVVSTLRIILSIEKCPRVN